MKHPRIQFQIPAPAAILGLFLLISKPAGSLAADPALAGDRIPAADGADVVVHPVNHASLVLGWKDVVIYVDPVGGAARYHDLPPATLVLVTDLHGDHLHLDTLKAVAGAKAPLVVPPAVAEKLPGDLQARATVLANGAKATVGGVTIEAVPAYNISSDRTHFHAKGRGNGYVFALGGKRIYLSGDTEDIPEMRALRDIDVAFVCMNLPYTMTVEQAADAVRAFKPRIVYPYHSRGSDTEKFKALVGGAAEVRLRDWYAPAGEPR